MTIENAITYLMVGSFGVLLIVFVLMFLQNCISDKIDNWIYGPSPDEITVEIVKEKPQYQEKSVTSQSESSALHSSSQALASTALSPQGEKRNYIPE